MLASLRKVAPIANRMEIMRKFVAEAARWVGKEVERPPTGAVTRWSRSALSFGRDAPADCTIVFFIPFRLRTTVETRTARAIKLIKMKLTYIYHSGFAIEAESNHYH